MRSQNGEVPDNALHSLQCFQWITKGRFLLGRLPPQTKANTNTILQRWDNREQWLFGSIQTTHQFPLGKS